MHGLHHVDNTIHNLLYHIDAVEHVHAIVHFKAVANVDDIEHVRDNKLRREARKMHVDSEDITNQSFPYQSPGMMRCLLTLNGHRSDVEIFIRLSSPLPSY